MLANRAKLLIIADYHVLFLQGVFKYNLILGCVHMVTKLHNIVICAVFPLDKMMGEVVENANNLG